ncbi:MAG: isocitrate lyase/PEP mutase family protein [Thaumarchaeota archaeon]|nr:isocitrate lyase/PEP mutase family protein [Candidatus Calditenuaceae archaeon]MDW8187537.1 isocitrate lyase/PEP mutase family protein [Nitrososphaerota archaeon]
MDRSRELRRLLKQENYVWTTGVYTPIQARLVEMVGLKAVYVSGYSCSVGYLVKPDIGFLTLPEMVEFAGRVVKAVRIPVISDADDGYGNSVTATRALEEFIAAGVAAIHVEDQRFPKRCGHLAGKRVLSFEEAVLKVKSLASHRDSVDPDFLLIARTDVLGTKGGTLEEAVRRAIAFRDAGADLLWAEFRRPNDDDAWEFAERVRREYPDTPLVFNYSSSFRWTEAKKPLRFSEIASSGYKLIIVSMGALHAEMMSVYRFAKALAERQEEAQWDLEHQEKDLPTANHHAIVRIDDYRRLEERFLPVDQLKEMY